MKQAFTILRVSSKAQKKKYGFDNQWEDDILVGAEALGLEVSEKLCRKVDETATKGDRADFTASVQEAIDLHSKGEVDAVLFPRVDRESRDAFRSIPLLLECFKSKLPVYFAFEELYLDPDDLEAKQKYIDAVNKSMDYIVTMKRNTLRGRKKRVKSGLLAGGRSSDLYGYDYIEGRRDVNLKTSRVLKQLDRWCLEGESINGMIARLSALGIKSPSGQDVWNRSAIIKILRNKAYTGHTTYWGTTFNQPALRTLEDHERIQARLERNKELGRHGTSSQYLLSGYIFCNECGRRYIGSKSHGIRYYYCPSGTKNISVNPCQGKSIRADKLESELWLILEAELSNPTNMVKVGLEPLDDPNYQSEFERIKVRLAHYDKEKQRCWRAFKITGDEKTFRTEIAQVDTEVGLLNKRYEEIEGLIKSAEQSPDLNDIQAACEQIYRNMGQLTYEDRRSLLDILRARYNPSTRRLEITLPCKVESNIRLCETPSRGG